MATVTQRALTHQLTITDQRSGEIVSTAGLVLNPGASLGATAEAMDLNGATISVQKRSSTHWAPVTIAGLNDHRIIQECLPVGASTAAGTWRHFLVFGQSNASGRGTVASLPSPWPPSATASGIYTLDRQFELRLATEALDADPTYPVDGADDEGATTVGASFATALADRYLAQTASGATRVCVTIVAKGGQAISAFAQSTSRNALYGQACARVKEATRLTGRKLDAVFWYQGETDAQAGDPTTWASGVQAVFTALRSDLGSAYAVTNLPIFVVRSPPTVPNTYNSSWWATLRSQQASLASAGPPYQGVIDAPDGPFDAQNLHLETGTTTTGVYGLGRSLADAFIAQAG